MKIILIGFSCSYKTSAGRILADKMGVPFVDTDEQITSTSGESVQEIFSKYGEEEFRQRENELLSTLIARNEIVIACGGGSVLCGNFAELCNGATVVRLTSTASTVMSRLGEISRPLSDGLTLAELEERLATRSSYYSKYADYKVATDGLTSEETAETVFDKLRQLSIE